MNRESFEVVAISPEPCAKTVFLRACKVLPPDDFRKLSHRFSVIFIYKPRVVY